jgi:hypothetical protein
MKIQTTVEVTSAQIANAMIGAVEQGSSAYWCDLFDVKVGGDYREPSFWDGEFEIEVTVNDEPPVTITPADLNVGLQIMATQYPRHFSDLIGDNDDGYTHDAMFQCAVLKDVVYG